MDAHATVTYLNHAGTSWPKPEAVRRAAARALESSPSEWSATFEAAHARIARAFGMRDTSRLLLTPGCTQALAVGIADLPFESGDRVLCSGLEHHALWRPVSQLRARGVEVGVVGRAEDGPLDLAALGAELARSPVRLVAMTAACNVTGELLPIDDVVRLAHEHGALCLVDGAQVCGWIDVDVEALGVDLFAFAGHKALQAPWGIGGLWVRPELALASPGAACELPGSATLANAPTACAPMPGYCDVGSVDRAALAGLVAALDWLEAPEQSGRLERARGLVEELALAAERLPGARLFGVRAAEARLPTVAFTLEGRAAGEVGQHLAARGVHAAAGLQCAPLAHESLGSAPGGAVRLSAGPGTGEADIERALEALSTL